MGNYVREILSILWKYKDVETIGNITDEAVQKYIKEQAEEFRKEDSDRTTSQTSNNTCNTALLGEQ